MVWATCGHAGAGAALILLPALGELPCPLCLLQRIDFIALGRGLLLNMRFGPSPLHYGLVIAAALFGAAAAGRQVLLHIVPGSGAYGSPLFGLHLYTWSLVRPDNPASYWLFDQPPG